MAQFFLGIGFCLILMPIIEGLMTTYQQYTEYVCTKIAVKTYKLKKLLEDDEPEQLEPCIGFRYEPSEEEEEDDEEEEEEDKCIGFCGG